ncbi:MAG: phosphate ABC transporter substrate-binding protein PstS [Xanthobacteraceae bacterium]
MTLSRTVAAAGVFAATMITSAAATDVSGAGATFPYPIYAKWAEAYKKEAGIVVNYRPIGSGDGIRQVQSKEVDFAATDMPLSLADLDMDGLAQFPTLTAGVVAVVNIDGVRAGDLTLDGATLARIFLGEIKTWNDPAIRNLNPGVRLPPQAITVVYRADGSGTTFLFTGYLAKASPDWRARVGSATAVEWPAGVAAAGNEGVANDVARMKGSIGYVEYAYAKKNRLTYTKLVNREGNAIAPDIGAFAAAAAGANWEGTPGFGVILTDEGGAGTWPIAGATFILMHKQPTDPGAAAATLKFFDWAYAKGGKMAEELDYVAMPASVVAAVRRLWVAQIKDARGKPIYLPSK